MLRERHQEGREGGGEGGSKRNMKKNSSPNPVRKAISEEAMANCVEFSRKVK